MRKEYDLSDAKRGPVLKPPGKERITILLDKDILAAFRERVSDTVAAIRPPSTKRLGITSPATRWKRRYAGWSARNSERPAR